MSGWQTYFVCKCGRRYQATFDNIFHLDFTVCPGCGKDKRGFVKKVMRWVWTGTWWNPLTWNQGHWVSK